VLGDRGSLLNFAQRAYIHVIGRSVFSKADRTICLTIDDASIINRLHCPWEKISVIPNGVDVNEFRPLDNETPSSLLWCGRFVHEKGLEYLVEALRIIVTEKKRRSIKLTMVGDGPLLPKIHELVERNGLDENVRFVGDLPHERIPTLMSEASVYVLPSLHEGMPYTLLEAMACGKPVIGSNIPGINDVIAHDRNGILVPAEDPKELACAIEKLLDDRKLRRDLGRNARQLVVMKYGWDTIVSRIERLYCEVAAGE
jgi:glycosyltransferase involved in cell wall biosynthesis